MERERGSLGERGEVEKGEREIGRGTDRKRERERERERGRERGERERD
jgi:hypothetical protein